MLDFLMVFFMMVTGYKFWDNKLWLLFFIAVGWNQDYQVCLATFMLGSLFKVVFRILNDVK